MPEFYEFAWFQKGSPTFGRDVIQKKLQDIPGSHLVLVRYKPEHRPFEEWVYNEAEIEHSKVMWAREINPVDDQQLINYFSERKVWLLEADAHPPVLSRCFSHEEEASPVSTSCGLHNFPFPRDDAFSQR
jgi:hypothetical protein